MPNRPGFPARDRVGVEFVEADVEIGFRLVDLAQQASDCGDSSRILDDAGGVLDDIDRRLSRLSSADRASFDPLVAELRREVEVARSPKLRE